VRAASDEVAAHSAVIWSAHADPAIAIEAGAMRIIRLVAVPLVLWALVGCTAGGAPSAAYSLKLGAGMLDLNVRKGQTTFTVSVHRKRASDSELTAAEKTLALAVLGRI
jgi:hypothetical protein